MKNFHEYSGISFRLNLFSEECIDLKIYNLNNQNDSPKFNVFSTKLYRSSLSNKINLICSKAFSCHTKKELKINSEIHLKTLILELSYISTFESDKTKGSG